jgi:Flp pilus assembly protein TadG
MVQRPSIMIRHRHGSVAVLIAVMLLVCGAVGIGVDVGTWQRGSIGLQLAADAGTARAIPTNSFLTQS